MTSEHHTLQHIAIIPDGNRTRATQQWLAAYKWHQAWYERTKEILEHVFQHLTHIVGVTYRAMSTENMNKRSEQEKTLLFRLLEQWLQELEPMLKKHNASFMRYGKRDGISDSLLQKLDALQASCLSGGKKVINLLFNYGGKWHIQDAMKRCIAAGKDDIAPYMKFWHLPPVDLIIRTKWAIRTSGFLPWEDYAEWHFTSLLYPEFTVEKLQLAIDDRATRKRNFWG
jgi:undecaprenyl diphosphate synthase